MGVINSPLVEGGVFSEEVNKKEVTVNGVNSNKFYKKGSPYMERATFFSENLL